MTKSGFLHSSDLQQHPGNNEDTGHNVGDFENETGNQAGNATGSGVNNHTGGYTGSGSGGGSTGSSAGSQPNNTGGDNNTNFLRDIYNRVVGPTQSSKDVARQPNGNDNNLFTTSGLPLSAIPHALILVGSVGFGYMLYRSMKTKTA